MRELVQGQDQGDFKNMATSNPFKRILLAPILVGSRLLVAILRLTKRGSGTALPGLLVNRYFPFAFEALLDQIPNIIVITGTNGKTTTQTILSSLLSQSPEVKLLRNSAGANLRQGILSELMRQANFFGSLDFTHAVLEVEEATLPRIAKALKPKIIAVTNLYRDQLDAYGEIDITEAYIRDGIAQSPMAIAVVNGDDPRTSRLAEGLGNQTHYVSLPVEYTDSLPYEGETRNTDAIATNILRAKNIRINDDLTTSFDVTGQVGNVDLQYHDAQISSPGFFHVYNALTAITIGKLLNIDDKKLMQGLTAFEPAFGRGELLVKTDGKKSINYRLLLIKNPASFTLNLDLLRKIPRLRLILAINDNTADSKDVSWLWDSELELLNKAHIDWVICTGVRAKDMHLRLKYAFTEPDHKISTMESIQSAIDLSFEQAADGDTVCVMPTYTSMLEFRKLMGLMLN
ncbi:MAG: MurT ligase domain-containing protein [Thermosynechococcaceae cyanobacterium]